MNAMKSETLPFLILLLNFASAWMMVGLIWLIQIVHYPLFAFVGKDAFVSYASQHVRSITLIVAPIMLIELVTSIALFSFRPPAVQKWMVILGMFLVAVAWISTWLLQIPAHEKLVSGFDSAAYLRLVGTNWIRTIAWTCHGIVTGWMCWMCLTTID